MLVVLGFTDGKRKSVVKFEFGWAVQQKCAPGSLFTPLNLLLIILN